MEELPKLLASRRAHKAYLTKLRHKIDKTAKGTITHNEIALLKSLVDLNLITPPPVSTFHTSHLPKLVLPSFDGNPLE